MLQNTIYKQIVLFGLIFCIIIFWYISARNGFPVLGLDTICFLPTSYYLEEQNLLVNNLFNPLHLPGSKFLFYPPFFPIFVSKLNHFFNSNAKVFLSLCIQVAAFLTGIRTIFIIYKGEVYRNLVFTIFLILALAACLTMANSRPESLCKLFLIVYLFSISVKSSKLIFVFQGIIIALSIITSFIFGLYLILIHLFYVNVSERIDFKPILFSALGALTVAAWFVFIYPYTIKDLLINMQMHGRNTYVAGDAPFSMTGFIPAHVLGIDNSFGIVLFIYCIYLSFLLIKFIYKKSKIRFIQTLLFLTIFLILLLSMKRVVMTYYLYVLSPIFIFIILKYESIIKNRTRLSTLLLMLVSISFFRTIYVVSYSLVNDKINIDKFSGEINQLIPDKSASIYFTGALWPVLIKYPNASAINAATEFSDSMSMKPDYIILQQVNSNKKTPPPINNFELIVNKFDPTPVRLFKLKLASQANAYEYAVYKKMHP